MPDETSPHGGEALHPLPERARIPAERPGAEEAGRPDGLSREAVSARPALPTEPEPMAADVEDDEADPVVESGPGVADDTGKPSVTRQPGG